MRDLTEYNIKLAMIYWHLLVIKEYSYLLANERPLFKGVTLEHIFSKISIVCELSISIWYWHEGYNNIYSKWDNELIYTNKHLVKNFCKISLIEIIVDLENKYWLNITSEDWINELECLIHAANEKYSI